MGTRTRTDHTHGWLGAYARAWEQRDPDAAAALFSEPCTYRSLIFEEPHRGRAGVRAYWERATGSQSGVRVRTGDPVASGPTVVAEWWATMTDEQGDITLPGVLVLAFDDDGLCRSLREYWAFAPGHREPPPYWGRTAGGGDGAPAAAFGQAWAQRYERAWRALDAGAIPPLFSEDALYSSHPLREPERGRAGVRAYTERAYRAEAGAPVDARVVVVASAGRTVAVEYWARTVEDGEPVTLAGCDVLLFDEAGLCTMLREYWHAATGHHAPPEEWGT